VRPARLVGVVVVCSLLSVALVGQGQTLRRGVQPSLAPLLREELGGDPLPLRRGTFTALTYNVAGLPQILSRRQPSRHNPLIGPLLGRYDVVLLQEDFAYGAQLAAGVSLPFHSPPHPVRASIMTMGDGLSQYARFPFEDFERIRWRQCSGLLSGAWDCAARKGFTYSRLVLDEGVDLDVYNLHLDAGWGPGDWGARAAQVTQLIAEVRLRSAGRAVIVAGDTNLRWTGLDPESLQRLLVELELDDACHALRCRRERVDRILFRSGADLALTALRYFIPDEFVDERGEALSDHHPVAVTFDWAWTSHDVATRE
jgi:hypothetical protein